MDGMIVQTVHWEVLGKDDEATFSHTITLPSPTATIAEITCAGFSNLYGGNEDATGWFTACTTDGSNPPLPANETFDFMGSISGKPRQLVIRNGLTSITYEIDIQNCSTYFLINLFFWPAGSLDRGNA